MRISDIEKVINGQMELSFLNSLILSEVSDYQKGIKKKGASVPIIVEGKSNNSLVINPEFVEKLLQCVRSDRSLIFFISYLSDAILLIENVQFKTELLQEIVESLTDYFYVNNLTNNEIDRISFELLKTGE